MACSAAGPQRTDPGDRCALAAGFQPGGPSVSGCCCRLRRFWKPDRPMDRPPWGSCTLGAPRFLDPPGPSFALGAWEGAERRGTLVWLSCPGAVPAVPVSGHALDRRQRRAGVPPRGRSIGFRQRWQRSRPTSPLPITLVCFGGLQQGLRLCRRASHPDDRRVRRD